MKSCKTFLFNSKKKKWYYKNLLFVEETAGDPDAKYIVQSSPMISVFDPFYSAYIRRVFGAHDGDVNYITNLKCLGYFGHYLFDLDQLKFLALKENFCYKTFFGC